MLPWITTPEFSTWSITSSREISSSGAALATSSSGLVGMSSYERVRRPRASRFDAPFVSPALRKFRQHGVPLLAVSAADEERGLPLQPALSAGNFPPRHRVRGNFRERLRQLLHLRRELGR